MYKPIILQENGKIVFYKSFCKTEEEIMIISSYLKTISMQMKVDKLFEIYQLDDYSLISLVLDGNDNKNKFIKFIFDNSEYPFPKVLLDRIENIELNIKEVKLELGDGEVLLKIIRGDISFIEKLNKDNKIIDKASDNIYIFNNNNLSKVFNKLNKNNVVIRLPKCVINKFIEIAQNKISMRYYQEEAFEFLKDRSSSTLIMPIFSGKNYVALNIIYYLKKKTLIFCHGKEQLERWQEQLIYVLGISGERITVCDSKSFVDNDFILCNYEYITKNREIIGDLIENEWGLVVYDDAHKAVTDKVIDILLIKSERKIALASSLDRNDGKEREIFSVFGEAIYNITNKELINNLYQKELEVQRINIKESQKSKEYIISKKLSEFENKRVIIAAHKVEDVESIARYLEINFLNKDIVEEDRKEIVEKFNNNNINILCCSNLIEKYRFMNVDVIIAAGYRGKSKIEENFRIGTLISTNNRLDKMKKVCNVYLYDDDKEEEIVNDKINYLTKWGLI